MMGNCLFKESYKSFYYAPGSNIGWHIVFVLSVCLSVVNINLRYNFWTVRDRGFIFGMHALLMTPFQMTPRQWPCDLYFDLEAKICFFDARLVGTYYGMARASVRLSVWVSVCGSVREACKHDRDWTVPVRTVKLGTHTTYDKRTNPIDFQGQGSKVKVTCWTLFLNLVNRIQTEPFQLGPLNLVHILLMTRRQHLLIFKVMGQRSRSQATHSC